MRCYLLAVVVALSTACGGSTSVTPTPPPAPPVPPPQPPPATFSGHVSDAIDGVAVGNASVTVPGLGSATTSANGDYTIAGTPGMGLFAVLRDGYWQRQAQKASDIDLLPQGKGFDLAFFDEVFRAQYGGTVRWTTQPTIEVYTQEYSCVTMPAGSELQCGQIKATATPAPPTWLADAQSVIAQDIPQYTGDALHPAVTLRADSAGQLRGASDYSDGTIALFFVRSGLKWPLGTSARVWRTGNQMAAANIQFHDGDYGRDSITHEIAHPLGFDHPGGASAVPLPSTMNARFRSPTAADILHGRILYRRPPGSRSPDTDPASTAALAPGPIIMRVVR